MPVKEKGDASFAFVDIDDFTPLNDKYHKMVPIINEEFFMPFLSTASRDGIFNFIKTELKAENKAPLYFKLEKHDGIWAQQLNTASSFIAYQKSLPTDATDESELITNILQLLKQFWANAMYFKKGDDLLSLTQTWLMQPIINGSPIKALALIESLYLMSQYMKVVQTHPPGPLARAMMPNALINGFTSQNEAMIQKHQTILSANPSLLPPPKQTKKFGLTYKNTPQLLTRALYKTRQELNQSLKEKENFHQNMALKLSTLKSSYLDIKTKENMTPAVFWSHYDTKDKLIPLLTLLKISKEAQYAWFVSLDAYYPGSTLHKILCETHYYLSGIVVTKALMESFFLKAIGEYYKELTGTPYLGNDVLHGIETCLSYIEARPYLAPANELHFHLDKLSTLIKSLELPSDLIKPRMTEKKSLLPSFFSMKTTYPIANQLNRALSELEFVKKQLMQQKNRLAIWLQKIELYNQGLDSDFFSYLSIDISTLDELYYLAINEMYIYIVGDNDNAPELLDEKKNILKKYHGESILQITNQITELKKLLLKLSKSAPKNYRDSILPYFQDTDTATRRFSNHLELCYQAIRSTLSILKQTGNQNAIVFFEVLNSEIERIISPKCITGRTHPEPHFTSKIRFPKFFHSRHMPLLDKQRYDPKKDLKDDGTQKLCSPN